MKYKIGIFGSGGSSQSQEIIKEAARQIGHAIGRHANEIIVITGGCSGLPYLAASAAAVSSTEVWGFSPVFNIKQQKEFTPADDLGIYMKLQFVPESMPFASNRRICMKYRNVLSTAECDAGIIISGLWGSLNEFTNLVDMQKIVGVLTGTGGVADELPALTQKIVKEGQGKIVFNNSPKALVEELLKQLSAKTA